jgi:hypothetical protein
MNLPGADRDAEGEGGGATAMTGLPVPDVIDALSRADGLVATGT